MKNETAAYTLARLPIGFSYLGHGFIRIPKLQQFSEGMIKGFSETPFPLEIVKPFSLVWPFVELLLGIVLIAGWKMKTVSAAGVISIVILIIGSSFQENWSAVSIQMFYGIYLVGLYLFSGYNRILFTDKKS
ncbi:DoxX family protein [Sinomicrobium soli]|uniref:DoxX family protein n=1 Tax=Sinomicrobium sp. N-1-3-6 TaxID=2219864 RepID=UPI000DCE8447|nr:DoxX family protein [Sinomicrobium sp. N-1-3-6]RAV28918.1 DoxX family protein [Sinomicrobium sp. N-1-3-6]